MQSRHRQRSWCSRPGQWPFLQSVVGARAGDWEVGGLWCGGVVAPHPGYISPPPHTKSWKHGCKKTDNKHQPQPCVSSQNWRYSLLFSECCITHSLLLGSNNSFLQPSVAVHNELWKEILKKCFYGQKLWEIFFASSPELCHPSITWDFFSNQFRKH